MAGPISRVLEDCISPAMAPSRGLGDGRLPGGVSRSGGRAISVMGNGDGGEIFFRRCANCRTKPPAIGRLTITGPAICGGGNSPYSYTVVPICSSDSPTGRGGG